MHTTTIGTKVFDWKHTYIMGIVNVTDDSFSGDGLGSNAQQARTQALRMQEEGADILDIGGESTRRFALYYEDTHPPSSLDDEMRRVIPLIQNLQGKLDIPLSLDTYKPELIKAGLDAGAHMINYAWGDTWNDEVLSLAASYSVPICLMHNHDSPNYKDVVSEVKAFLLEEAALAEQLGVKKEHIILDPGIGFRKTIPQSLQLLKHIKELHLTNYPILLGASRKSVIWKTLETSPQEALEGSLSVALWAKLQGVQIIRTHDVLATRRALTMLDAITSS